MLTTTLELASRLTNKASVSDNIVNVIEHSFNKMSADLSNNLVKALLPCNNNSVAKEKHVVLVEIKDNQGEIFDSMAWNEIVKNKLGPSLKNVPIEKAVLNKQGKGCLILPNKEAQNEVKAALESDFNVTASTKPKKNVSPKIKVFGVDVAKCHDKHDLRSAILEKNNDINDLVQQGGNVIDVLFIDTKWKYAILKVSPEIRSVINKKNVLHGGVHDGCVCFTWVCL